jgi:hypothetical protein
MNQKPCSPISTFLVESADSLGQPNNLEEYEQLSLLKLIPTHNSSSDITSQEYQFTQISETTEQNQESLKSLPAGFPAQAQVTQELERDYLIQNHLSGEKEFAALSKHNRVSVLLSNLKELSDEDLELFLPDSIWQDTLSRLKQSRRRALELSTKDSDCLSFPTPTSNECSKGRPAGQTKCEKWFKEKGLVPPGYQLGREAIALIMGFPSDWFDPLCQSQPAQREESEPDTSQDEPLPQDKQPLPSVESSTSTQLLGGENNSPLSTESSSSYAKRYPLGVSKEISIPCLVKQPGKPEVRGVIKEDKGGAAALAERDRFLVDVDGEEVSISKLFVYPDFSQSVGQIEKNPSKISTPSKTRRRKGEGNGSIHWRTVIRNGKEYRQAYYHWVEDGKKRTKYIPKKLLDRVCEAESLRQPLADILILLGGKNINPSKSSDTLFDKYSEAETVGFPDHVPRRDDSESDLEINPSKVTPPSKNRRSKGKGSGWIECKPIKRGGKEYQQYWYHWEEWSKGDRITKKSKYISQTQRSLVEKMNNEKVPVEEILRVLRKRVSSK